MCGRYTLRAPNREVAAAFDLPEVPEIPARYNIAPTQPVPAVRTTPDGIGRELVSLRWGLIPSWADDPAIGNRMINARAETVASKPAYRRPFRTRRCLIVGDGFYEWRQHDGRKQPYYIRRKDDRPFAFAGLWDQWGRDAEVVRSCTIITTEANELMAPIHDRMPVIVPPAAYGLWLDPAVLDPGPLREVLRPYPPGELEAFPVSTFVNRPAH
ncbi:MAG TPA: SOS response-associated peptidase, partial [Isosphaeraceae bacterium]